MRSNRHLLLRRVAPIGLAALTAAAAYALPQGSSFCDGTGAAASTVACPCGNNAPAGGEGCANSTGNGARLVNSGGTSILLDDTVLDTTQMPTNKLGFTYYGPNPWVSGTTFGVQHSDGVRCLLAGGTSRLPNQNTGSTGSFSYSGLFANHSFPALAGETWYFQSYYRDLQGPCGTGANFSNGWQITFTP